MVTINMVRYFTGGARKMAVIAPALFLNHGGGPLTLLGSKNFTKLAEYLQNKIKTHVNIEGIKAIVLVTSHFEENVVTISSGKHHNLYFDYYGFPPESYEYKYDAPGDPKTAERIHDALKKAGIPSKLDAERGWDHGVFVPMMQINPAADIPIIQVSVISNQDPKQHYELGQVLYQFRKEGIAIIGSGMSYHNMEEFLKKPYKKEVINKEFDDYLNKICTTEDENNRKLGLINWRDQPGATEAHPVNAAEHLMPLIVVAGAGSTKPGVRIFNWDMNGTFRLSGFIWKDV